MKSSESDNGGVLFLVPARGGSKGVNGKNLRAIGGIPLVGWAVRNALRAARALEGSFSRGHAVVCSTDDPRIAAVAREWGADVPFVRPAALAGDAASSDDVALHALGFLEGQGRSFAAIARVQPTSPLALPEDLVSAVRLCLTSGRSVASVSAARPPSWTFRMESSGCLEEVVPDPPGVVGRQDYPPYYSVNGAVCVSLCETLQRTRNFIQPGVTLGSMLPVERGIDVDSEQDLELCRLLMSGRATQTVAMGPLRVGDGFPRLRVADCQAAATATELLNSLDAAAQGGAQAVAAASELLSDPFLLERAARLGLLAIGAITNSSAAPQTLQGFSALAVALDRAGQDELRRLAGLGKPLLLRLHGAALSQVARLVDTLALEEGVALMLEAPTPAAVPDLRAAFSRPVGAACRDGGSTAAALSVNASFVLMPAGGDPASGGRLAELCSCIRDADGVLGRSA